MEENNEERLTWPLSKAVLNPAKQIENHTKFHYLSCENDFLEKELLLKLKNSKKKPEFFLPLLQKIRFFDDIIRNLEQKNQESRTKLEDYDSLNAKFRALSEENQLLRKECEEMKEQFRISEEKSNENSQKIKEISELKKKISLLESELSKTQNKNLSLFNEICAKNVQKAQENMQFKQENEHLKRKLSEYERKLESNEPQPLHHKALSNISLGYGAYLSTERSSNAEIKLFSEQSLEKSPLKGERIAENPRNSVKEKDLERKNSPSTRFSFWSSSKPPQELKILKEEKTMLEKQILKVNENILILEEKNETLTKNLELKEQEIFQILGTYQKELSLKTQENDSLKAKIRELESGNVGKTIFFGESLFYSTRHLKSGKHVRQKSTPEKSTF